MIPIYLDPTATRVALIGRGTLALRRLRWLEAAGAAPRVWSDAPSAEFAEAVGARFINGLPGAADLSSFHAIWIADLPHESGDAIARLARDAGVLVNVEDVLESCDFHTPAVLRRGKLTLAAGTGGASPAVARAARERLEEAFSPAWEAALEEIAESRAALRAQSAGFDALIADARARLAHHGLI